jgi:hypothetical protein
MNIITLLQNKKIQPKAFIYICLAVVALLVLLHVFMLSVVFPHQAGFMNLHIPSRSGGYDLYVDTVKFTSINGIILAGAAFITAVVVGLTRLKKDGAATGVAFVLLVASVVYIALYCFCAACRFCCLYRALCRQRLLRTMGRVRCNPRRRGHDRAWYDARIATVNVDESES